MTKTCTINLGDFSVEYNSTTSDTITLSPSTYSSDSSVTIATDFDINDWFEDHRIVEEYKEETAIRERNEGVQQAWEQYKIMVALAKNPPEDLDNLE